MPPSLNESFIAKLPKISLHDHLDGGLRPATVLELAEAAGIALPADSAEALADWFAEQSDAGSLVEYLKTFDLSTAVMQSADALRRVAREAVQDLAADKVIYAELRWAPEQHLAGGLSLDEAVAAVQQGIEEGIDDAADDGADIQVGQILTAMRHADRSLEIAELTLRHLGMGVVGFDIAGAEEGFPASRHRAAFDFLAEQLVPVTVHAGEAAGPDSIRSALVDGRALRLGHGVRIAEDLLLIEEDDESVRVDLGELADWVRDRQLPLELCPSSNLQTGAVSAWGESLGEHPFDVLYQLGFKVTVNTDNRLMSRTTISRELALLVEAFEYDLLDLEAFQLNAAEAAFAPLETRMELAERIREAYSDF